MSWTAEPDERKEMGCVDTGLVSLHIKIRLANKLFIISRNQLTLGGAVPS